MDFTILGTTHSTLLIGDMQAVTTHIGDIIITIIMVIILITGITDIMVTCTNRIIQNLIGVIMWLVAMKMSVAM